MAPSTVLSYLRRDYRRPVSPAAAHTPSPQSPVTPSDVQPQPQPQRLSIPPQLPAAPQTPTLTDSLLESGIWAEPEQKPQSATGIAPELRTREETEPKGGCVVATSSASQSSRILSRPHSSSDAEGRRAPEAAAGATSLTPDHHENPTSPLTLGEYNPADSGKWSTRHGKGKHTHDNAAASPSVDAKKSSMDGQSPLSASSAKRDVTHEDVTVPSSHSRPGKTKLNLLNPLALLARRRSAQPSTSKPDDIRVNRRELPALPDDYDPRIRGKHIHDFSLPRPRSHVSASNQQQSHAEYNEQDHSAPNADLEESDDVSVSAITDGAREQQPEVEVEAEDDGRESQEIPKDSTGQDALAPAPALPSPVGGRQSRGSQSEAAAPAVEDPASDGKEQEQEQPTATPSYVEGAAAPTSNIPSRSSTAATSSLPRHLRSSASRFSFDMAGVEESSSSQEKLLEEKHKEKEAARRAKVQETHFNDSDSEDIDYEAMLDDGGLEEEIPGVNIEAEDDYYDEDDESGGIPSHAHPLKPMPLRQFVPALSPLVSNPVSPLNLNSPSQPPEGGLPPHEENSVPPPSDPDPDPDTANPPSTSVLLDTTNNTTAPPSQRIPRTTEQKQAPTQILSDDDFYFDDGMFDDDDVPPPDEGEVFDESIFDDETSHLYARRKTKVDAEKPLPAPPEDNVSENLEKTEKHGGSLLRRDSTSPASNGVSTGVVDDDDDDSVDNSGHGHPANDSELHAGEDLTEDNLQAYHSALVQAAQQAALKGRFDRRVSGSEASVDNESVPHTVDSQPDLTADQSRVSQSMDQMAFEDDAALDDFDYDDRHGMGDDDAIIAAANAEVLEYDDEEFYGQEFGFYAHSRSCDGEPVYGGYFGARVVDGVSRSHSGGRAANFREPSLTPITERSEWSTRNSMVSLAAQQTGHSNPSLSSPPALAQLVDMGSIEDEMSLSALMKLRREAFGGSNGSLRSSAASPTSPSPTTGHQQVGSLNGATTTATTATSPPEAPKSGMQNSSPPPEMGVAADSSGPYQGQSSSAESSPRALPLQNDALVGGGKVIVPPPLSVDTARANASSP